MFDSSKKLEFSSGHYRQVVLLFCISCGLLLIQLLSLKTTTILFGKAYFKFVLISLSLTGVSFGIFVFYLFREFKLQDSLLLILYVLSLAAHLFPPYYFSSLSPAYFKLIFFSSLFFTYAIIGVLTAKLFYENLKKFPLFYAVHFFGMAIGVIVVTLMSFLGYLVVSYLFILANVILLSMYYFKSKFTKIIFVLLVLMSMGFVMIKTDGGRNSIPCERQYSEFGPRSKGTYVASMENLFSQIDVYKHFNQYNAWINCLGVTTVKDFDYNANQQLNSDFFSIPYYMKKQGPIAIIGSGAGIEVQRALSLGHQDITAIEINKNIIDLIYKILPDNSNPYNDQAVHLIIGEGRKTISKFSKKFELIHLPNVKGYGVLGVSNFNLIENYLFTVEAINEFYNQLASDGILVFTNMSIFIKYNVSTLLHFMQQKGITYDNHILVIDRKHFGLPSEYLRSHSIVLLKKNGFQIEDIQKIKENNLIKKFEIIDGDRLILKQENILTDNRPYFGHMRTFSVFLWKKIVHENKKNNQLDIVSSIILYFLKLSAIPLILAVISAIMFFKSRKKIIGSVPAIKGLLLVFFVACAYMLLEIGYLNSFFLVFENPLFSFTTLLFTYILFSGIGSLWSYYYEAMIRLHFNKILLTLSFIILVEVILLESILQLIAIYPIFTKLLMVIVLIGIPAFFAGSIFPVVIQSFSRIDRPSIIYFYLIDSLMSIFIGIIALILSVLYGFNSILILSALCYYILVIFGLTRIRGVIGVAPSS